MDSPDPSPYRTPGQFIQALLDQRNWTQRLLAVILGINEPTLSKIISGQKAVDAEMAILLESTFKIDANTFLDLQKTYDLAKARIVAPVDPNRAKRAVLFGDLPVQEMIKRQWLDAKDVRDVAQVEASLLKFFGVKSLGEIEVLPHAAKKQLVASDTTPPQLVWIYRVKKIADDMMVAKFSEFGVRSALKKLQPLMVDPDHARQVPRILAECGIRFVLCETIGSAKIDGVCLWLNDNAPVIGMTLRYDRIDNFWFVLRHEIEHVLRLHGRDAAILDAELEGERAGTGKNVAEEERVANEAAANFGVTTEMIKQFISRKSPIYREIDLLGFARTVRVHPGVVAGRLQYATDRYDLFRNHLTKVRSKIAPSAMVDGWGDVAPVEYE
jgi:HTH-type transcriptional regulator / antitoxin HigA